MGQKNGLSLDNFTKATEWILLTIRVKPPQSLSGNFKFHEHVGNPQTKHSSPRRAYQKNQNYKRVRLRRFFCGPELNQLLPDFV